MHPADIKAALEKAGSSQSAVARSLRTKGGGCITVNAVHLVVLGRSKSQRVALRVSEVTGIPVRELWPGKYPALEKQQVLQQTKAKKVAPIAPPPARSTRAKAPAAAPAADSSGVRIIEPTLPNQTRRKRDGPSAAHDLHGNHRERR